MSKKSVVEIRPGEGGGDAEAFAEELTAAFAGFARREGIEHTVEAGRTTVVRLAAPAERLAFMAGVHRVQRIPKNSKAGRRHTSTVSVVVLDDVPRRSVQVDLDEVTVEPFRGSGPGGQHRNTSDSCVRVRHHPTGLTAVATESRSQHVNREVALARLAERIEAQFAADAFAEIGDARRNTVNGGGREAKQWTWNQQRSEVVDHQSGRTWPMRDMLRGRFPRR